MDYLSQSTGQWIVNETSDGPNGQGAYAWDAHPTADDGKTADMQLDQLLKSISDQTGLTIKRDARMVDVWNLAAKSIPAATPDDNFAQASAYDLAPNQYCKFVPLPFIQQRSEFLISTLPENLHIPRNNLGTDCAILEEHPDGSFTLLYSFVCGGKGSGLPGMPVGVVAKALTGLRTWQISGDDSHVTDKNIPGDWVIRAGGTPDTILADMATALSPRTRSKLRGFNLHLKSHQARCVGRHRRDSRRIASSAHLTRQHRERSCTRHNQGPVSNR